MRYQFIREHESRYSIRSLCRVMEVSRSGFYEWRDRPCSARSAENTKLLACIRQIHQRSNENYGAIKTWKALQAQGHRCGRHRVARLRQTHGIEAKRLRRFRSGNAARHTEGIAPNLLRRRFTARATNQVWVGDTTFIATREGWLQLAILLDLHS
jgi:putative transposase